MRLPVIAISIIASSILLGACSREDETDSSQYQNGYEDGVRAGRRSTCKKIEEFNPAIKDTLAKQGIR